MSVPTSHRRRDDWMNQPDEYISQKTPRLQLSAEIVCIRNTWRKTEWASNMGKKNPLVGWLAERCRHAGRHGGEASLPLYDANCIQTPTHRAVSLTVKVRPDRQAGGKHSASNHNIWCLMPKIAQHFLLSHSLRLCAGGQTGSTNNDEW